MATKTELLVEFTNGAEVTYDVTGEANDLHASEHFMNFNEPDGSLVMLVMRNVNKIEIYDVAEKDENTLDKDV